MADLSAFTKSVQSDLETCEDALKLFEENLEAKMATWSKAKYVLSSAICMLNKRQPAAIANLEAMKNDDTMGAVKNAEIEAVKVEIEASKIVLAEAEEFVKEASKPIGYFNFKIKIKYVKNMESNVMLLSAKKVLKINFPLD